MIRRAAKSRSGITLTEILISILILGVGMISLATLFPLGLLRLRNAQRLVRGALLMESAQADLGARNLLSKSSFTNLFVNPFYQTKPVSGGYGTPYNPWLVDTPSYGGLAGLNGGGVVAGYLSNSVPLAGPGLPVVYDPLWRAVTGVYPDNLNGTTVAGSLGEARFGSGIGWIRPSDPGGGQTSCWGPQRVTNLTAAFASVALDTFISKEDIVLQDTKAPGAQYTWTFSGVSSNVISSPSPIVPDMTLGVDKTKSSTTTNDWRYTWFFTGRQADVSNAIVFDGDVVICENRPFGFDQVTCPFPPGSVYQAAGETVVEAVWGFSGTNSAGGVTGTGYGTASAKRSVLIRWPSTMADPDVRVGNWICDNTYERVQATSANRYGLNSSPLSLYPGQRCYWYQVVKRTDAAPGGKFNGDTVSYREMVLTLNSPVRAQTRLSFPGGSPYHVESAVLMPCVVNVFPPNGLYTLIVCLIDRTTN